MTLGFDPAHMRLRCGRLAEAILVAGCVIQAGGLVAPSAVHAQLTDALPVYPPGTSRFASFCAPWRDRSSVFDVK